MAVDTRDKRFAMIGLAGLSPAYPNPDGTIANTDRAQYLRLYPYELAEPSAGNGGFNHWFNILLRPRQVI